MKFTIRDLLLVTMIVALAVGWWLDHRSLARSKNKAEVREGIERNNQKLIQHILVNAEGYTVTEDAEGHVSILAPPSFSAPAPNPPKK